MKSITALTFEMDDMKVAAKQLADQVKSKLTLMSKTFGVVYVDSELNHNEFMTALHDELPIDIIGCTTIAIIDGNKGFCEMCTSLVVVTGDDFEYSTVLSEPITAQNVHDVIEQSYKKGADELAGDVKLIYTLPPYNLDIMLDEFPDELSRVSGGLPVFGGLASYNDYGDTIANLYSDSAYDDRMILLMLGGNVKPVFNVGSVVERFTNKKEVVTKSEKNIVYTVGSIPFLDYYNSLGISMLRLNENEGLPYVSTPIVIETTDMDNDDGVAVVRAIHAVNKEDGSCVAICNVPQNSYISIASLTSNDIETSSRNSIEMLLKKMNENSKDGYEYSTVFCISCVGRFLIMAPENDVEGKALAQAVPNNIQVSGYYGYGELGPTSIREGKAVNRAHNHSITMMAI